MKRKLLKIVWIMFIIVFFLLNLKSYAGAEFIIIDSLEDYIEFAKKVTEGHTYEGIEIELLTDIDFNGSSENPTPQIGGIFKGNFNGNGHKLKNIYMDSKNAALFTVNEGYIAEIVLESGEIKAENEAAVICNYNNENGIIDRCASYVSVEGTKNVGGLVGVNRGRIYNSYVQCKIKSNSNTYTDYIGGITSFVDKGELMNCFFVGSVECRPVLYKIGLLYGNDKQGDIENCYPRNSIDRMNNKNAEWLVTARDPIEILSYIDELNEVEEVYKIENKSVVLNFDENSYEKRKESKMYSIYSELNFDETYKVVKEENEEAENIVETDIENDEESAPKTEVELELEDKNQKIQNILNSENKPINAEVHTSIYIDKGNVVQEDIKTEKNNYKYESELIWYGLVIIILVFIVSIYELVFIKEKKIKEKQEKDNESNNKTKE